MKLLLALYWGKMDMNNSLQYVLSIDGLQSRIRRLEFINQSLVENINQLKSLGDFIDVHQVDENPAQLFSAIRYRIRSFLPLRTIAFLLVSKDDNDFFIADCDPVSDRVNIQKNIDAHINAGTFSWALRQNRTTVSPTASGDQTIIFHPLVSRSEVHGMFVGIVDNPDFKVSDLSLGILSIICSLTSSCLGDSSQYQNNYPKQTNDVSVV
jgi:two-component system, sensor histidine kinase